MTGKVALKKALANGCATARQKGSHVRVVCPCGKHQTTIALHAGDDLPKGTQRGIEKDLACLPKGWLR